MNIKIPHKKRVLAIAAISVVVCLAVITVFTIMRTNTEPAASPQDCAAVEQITRKWNRLIPEINNELSNGPGERSDWLSVAERESEMSDELQEIADTVSEPVLKIQLYKWASGTRKIAKLQEEVVNRPRGPEPPDNTEKVGKAMALVFYAIAELRKTCPNMPKYQEKS
ncbi:hypothetical protein [Mycobacterium sp.]|uniref:hypothetical protein n=1 Tax=Mycobacterium sp. TaxID=1785 RepID=UPI003BAD80C7